MHFGVSVSQLSRTLSKEEVPLTLSLRSFPVYQEIVYSWRFSKRDCFKKQKSFVSFSSAYALSTTQRKHIHDFLRVACCSATDNRRRRNCRIIDRQKWSLVRYHEKSKQRQSNFSSPKRIQYQETLNVRCTFLVQRSGLELASSVILQNNSWYEASDDFVKKNNHFMENARPKRRPQVPTHRG